MSRAAAVPSIVPQLPMWLAEARGYRIVVVGSRAAGLRLYAALSAVVAAGAVVVAAGDIRQHHGLPANWAKSSQRYSGTQRSLRG